MLETVCFLFISFLCASYADVRLAKNIVFLGDDEFIIREEAEMEIREVFSHHPAKVAFVAMTKCDDCIERRLRLGNILFTSARVYDDWVYFLLSRCQSFDIEMRKSRRVRMFRETGEYQYSKDSDDDDDDDEPHGGS